MVKGVNLDIHGFSFCFYPQHMKMLKISIKNSVAKHVLLNKVVCKTCHSHLLDGEQCKWRSMPPSLPPVRALEDEKWCCLTSPEECFPSKGACPMLKEMSKVLFYLMRGRNILGECTMVAVGWHEMCMFDWEREGFGVFLSFFAVVFWRPPDCVRQWGLAREWVCMFHLETMHPRQYLFLQFHIPAETA